METCSWSAHRPRGGQRIVAAAVCLMLTGCAASGWWNQRTELRLGMSKPQVQAILGPPQRVTTQPNMRLETWTYLDKTVTFHQDMLFSWEESSLQPQEGR